jgi:hypothetical protein
MIPRDCVLESPIAGDVRRPRREGQSRGGTIGGGEALDVGDGFDIPNETLFMIATSNRAGQPTVHPFVDADLRLNVFIESKSRNVS